MGAEKKNPAQVTSFYSVTILKTPEKITFHYKKKDVLLLFLYVQECFFMMNSFLPTLKCYLICGGLVFKTIHFCKNSFFIYKIIKSLAKADSCELFFENEALFTNDLQMTIIEI
jgi:hypothetical protein